MATGGKLLKEDETQLANRNYVQINDAGKVFAISQIACDLVSVVTADNRLLGTTYNTNTGAFVGYNIVLTADKQIIAADGVDSATITATVYTWDEQVATNFAEDIIFEFEGMQSIVTPVNGVCGIPFVSSEIGDFVITTVNDGATIIANGTITISAEVQA